MTIPPSFRLPRFVAPLLLTFAIALSIFIGGTGSAVSRRPQGSNASPIVGPGQQWSIARGRDRERMTRTPEIHHDTSPLLRDMAQMPVKANELSVGQTANVQETMTARGTGSGVMLVAGISPDTDSERAATQHVKIADRSYQIFDNLTGDSLLGPSDISTIWAGFGGSCETGRSGSAVVIYDKVADRWVFTQFGSVTDGKTVTEQCFAVSMTSDATGSYYRYAFHLGGNFIDTPHVSVQSDGYLMGDGVFNESGDERLGTQFFLFDRIAMLAGTAASFTTPGIDNGTGETYSISAAGVRLVSATDIAPAVSTLTINLTYDTDATFTNAGLTAQNITDMKAATAFAAAQFTNNFTDPINVNIFVTAVPGTTTLGMSNFFLRSDTFSDLRAKTVADAKTADDTTSTGGGGSIPAADPVSGSHTWWVATAQSKALGISADSLTRDGTFTFGGGLSYAFDPANRAIPGRYDFIGVSMHELTEIMGRASGMATADFNSDGIPDYLQMDLFHYTGAGTRGLNNGPGRFFSINNGTTLLKAFNDNAARGGDLQDWASGSNDSFNAFSSSGVKNDLTAVDLRVMDVIGYDFGSTPPTPPPNDNFTNAQVITGSSGTANGPNVNATKESGEPNHANNAGGASVWYQWQAPASGTATITTANSNFDTVLGVYTGSTVSGLTTIASNDDESFPSIVTSKVTFNAVAGTIYRIAVDGFDGATGNITLNWSSTGTTFTISVSASPTAGGTVGGGGTFAAGSSRTVTATANSGFTFSNWTESGTVVSTSASYTFTLNGNRTLVANFTQVNYTIAVSASPTAGGTVGGGGTFAAGSSRTVTATANSGFTFSNWTESGTIVSTSASYTFTLNGNRTLVANFTQVNYTIAVSASPTAGGTVGGGGTFAAGSSRTVTATANSGFTFSNWTESGTVVSTSASYTFTLNGNRTLVANFTQNISITVQTNPTGRTFTVDGTSYSATQTFSWVPGSSHTISTTSPQAGSTGTRFVWTNWSDGGAISHTVTPTVVTTYTANFTTQFMLTMAAGTGGTVSPASGFFNSGQSVNISATTNSGFAFSSWTGSGTGSFTGTTNPASVSMNGPITETASFTQNTIQTTVQTNSAGRTFTVDGTSYSATQTFSWVPGSSHTIVTTSPQAGPAGTQYVWNNWSDGGAISHTVTPTVATTYTANFTTQFMLTMTAGAGGTVSPASGFVNSGLSVNISATPNSGFTFSSWTGSGTGSFSGATNPATVTMNGPITETAGFAAIPLTIQFSASTYNINEGAGFLNATVTRSGDVSNTASVTYATSNGTAKEGADYVAAQGVLNFAAGETGKTFPVLVIDNAFVDGARTVNLTLRNPSGATLGQSTAVVTIIDNDLIGGENPLDTPRSFVQYDYYDFLGRYPDQSGWDFWTNQITNCGANVQCVEVQRINVSASFFLSIEFQQTGYMVERFYKVALGNANGNSTFGGNHQLPVPIIRFDEFLRDSQRVGRGVVVLAPGWEQLLESNKQAYALEFVQTARFITALPTSMTPAKFVDQLNQNAGNVLSSSERTTAINLFSGATDTSNTTARAQALRQVAEDIDLYNAEYNRAFVLAEYFGYLRRNPNDAPDSDYTGYDFWLTKLNQFNGNYINAEMVKAFLSSIEYRQRFGP